MPGGCARSGLPRADRREPRAPCRRPRAFREHLAAICESAHACRSGQSVSSSSSTPSSSRGAGSRDAGLHADAPSARVRRGRRVVGDRAARGLAGDADRSELVATALLAGVATVIAIGECVQSIVLGPLVRRRSSRICSAATSRSSASTFTAASRRPRGRWRRCSLSPDAVWWGGALVAGVIGAGFSSSAIASPTSRRRDRVEPARGGPWPGPRDARRYRASH